MSARSLDDHDDAAAEDDATRRRKWTEACGRDTLTRVLVFPHISDFLLHSLACIVVLFLFSAIFTTLSVPFLH